LRIAWILHGKCHAQQTIFAQKDCVELFALIRWVPRFGGGWNFGPATAAVRGPPDTGPPSNRIAAFSIQET